jgi:predicted Ser/Thr protein kinase
MPDSAPSIRLLQANVDPGDNESEFRILVDGKFVKYLTIEAGVYDVDDMCFEPSLVSILPTLPPGDWSEGQISKTITTGLPHFTKTAKSQLPGITNLWHTLQIDHLELHMGTKLRSNVYEATSVYFNETVVAKFARFAWEIPHLEAETTAYQWINEHQIGPKFLEDRVIGFIIERVPSGRHAEPEDLALCQETLSRLHTLGFKHGDINKHNFLIHDRKAILIDMESATRCSDTKVLDEEFGRLKEELRDTSGRGGSKIAAAVA